MSLTTIANDTLELDVVPEAGASIAGLAARVRGTRVPIEMLIAILETRLTLSDLTIRSWTVVRCSWEIWTRSFWPPRLPG